MVSDRIFGLGIIFVALFYLWSAANIQIGFLSDPVGSRTFPYLIGGIALLCALVFVVRPDPDPVWPRLPTLVRIVAAIAVMYLFSQTLKPLGFIIPAAIASGVLSYLISPRLLASALTGIGLSIGLFIAFNSALGLSLSPFGRLITG
ncbi:MAG: tripartite tricarboxylate transporter TctB family protein [Rhodobacteraceae bacterium]|nr:tripartite tricarboxylate transporter TctB family protein [Paracoccaceae bacterium]